ncbi:UNVERIFIED_CONTAM: hypothetical protein PYX00_001453 [Menopon gallinae]|uniref:BTB domain-containing protein n=1 Tax=Menopon gallinae TaxID=328185 RepID=A0AAW2IDA6_9NEOP
MDDKVVIVIESKNYEVSKAKLIEKSSYYKSMLNGDFLEKNKSTVNIKGVSVESWERILYYLENGKMKPEVYSEGLYKELLYLLEAAAMLQFSEIQEYCTRKLYVTLEAKNALDILEVASKLDLDVLIQKARAIALWNSEVITNSDAFFNLNADQVEGYLSDPALHSPTGEWGVWEAVNRWINSPPDFKVNRTEFLPQLIKCVSLERLSLSDIKTIALNDVVRSNPLVSAALKIIVKELSPKETESCDTSETEALTESSETDQTTVVEGVEDFIKSWREMPPRKLPLVPAVIAKVNKEPSLSSPYVVRFSEEEKKFIPEIRLDEVETNLGALVGFKVIADGSKLYMLGGEILTRQASWYYAVWQYDQIIGRWLFLANLRKEVRHCSACVVGDYLYVIGGFGRHRLIQDTVSKLSLTDRTWTVCSPLPRPMYSAPCCVFKDNIYVIQTQVYQYSTERDMWTTLDISLPSRQVFSNVVVNDDYIFISGINRIVYKFDPSLPTVELTKVGTFTYECWQACLIDDHIYSLSQEEFDSEIYCEKMNVKTGENTVLFRGIAENEIATLNPNHHHGCFPLLFY